jgi:uncharacterized membrane protein YsdA (DUF1294 family)
MTPFSPESAAIVTYIFVNVFVFCLYGYDKKAARAGGWRISENSLLGAAIFGPFGAYGAMAVFRHKTRKMKFYLVPVFMILHIAGMLYLVGALVIPSF